MKKHKITIPEEAEHDLFDIYDYIARHDSTEHADYVLYKLESLIYSLDHNPERGHIPQELDRISVKDFKELHFKPYRLIYQLVGSELIVLACFDRRRDIQSLLERRLTR